MSHLPRHSRGMIIRILNRVDEVVATFGRATLHRRFDGRYELRNGSDADRAAALEWASLFQHDAVFSSQLDHPRSSLPAPRARW